MLQIDKENTVVIQRKLPLYMPPKFTKNLIIIHRLCAGNVLKYYDQNLRVIDDIKSLYEAETVIFTNHIIQPDEDIQGAVKFKGLVQFEGKPMFYNKLTMLPSSYIFIDEYSLLKFSVPVEDNSDAAELVTVYVG